MLNIMLHPAQSIPVDNDGFHEGENGYNYITVNDFDDLRNISNYKLWLVYELPSGAIKISDKYDLGQEGVYDQVTDSVTVYMGDCILTEPGKLRVQAILTTSNYRLKDLFNAYRVGNTNAVIIKSLVYEFNLERSLNVLNMEERPLWNGGDPPAFLVAYVAREAAEFEYTDRVYVYLGDEEGYVAGDWYYWDGYQWVDGGEYNSIMLETDKTLSVEGMAADAAAVRTELEKALSRDVFTGRTLDEHGIPDTKLGYQRVNTFCRLYKIQDAMGAYVDPSDFDQPEGVDLLDRQNSPGYYAWMFTAGTANNRVQILIDAHTKKIFYRFFTGITETRPTGWTDWYELLEGTLRLSSFTGAKLINGQPDTKLGYQDVNTFCRLTRIRDINGNIVDPSTFDQPEGVDLLDYTGAQGYYAWLFTVGGENKMQYLFDAHTSSLYFRFFRSGSWTNWVVPHQDSIRQKSFSGTKVVTETINGVETQVTRTKLEYQPVNTVCRLYGIQLPEGQSELDVPEEVNITGASTDYAWLFTVGGSNRMQYLFYSGIQALYYRFYRSSAGSYTDWYKIGGRGGSGSARKELNILMIGNSFTQSSMAYVPPILNKLLPDYDITYCVMYQSSATCAQHVHMYNNDIGCEVRSLWVPDGTAWIRDSNNKQGVLLKDTLKLMNWDIIGIMATSEEMIDTSAGGVVTTTRTHQSSMINSARELIRILQRDAPKPFSLIWSQQMGREKVVEDSVTSQVFRTYSGYEMFERAVNTAKIAMNNLALSCYAPVGAAIQSARTVSDLRALGTGNTGPGGTGNMLFSDNKHLQCGIPCLIAAYVMVQKFLSMTGNRHVSVLGSDFIPSTAKSIAMNAAHNSDPTKSRMVHGWSEDGGVTMKADGVTPTDETMRLIRLSQEIAVLAENHPDTVTNIMSVNLALPGDFEVVLTNTNNVWSADKSINDIALAVLEGYNVYGRVPVGEYGAYIRMELSTFEGNAVVFSAVVSDREEDEDGIVTELNAVPSAILGYRHNGADYWKGND